ncbi:MarR family transcriptional regulator [Enterobacter cloacae]|nr:MarR family transcriptional regulator [Enterobacter cloacae]
MKLQEIRAFRATLREMVRELGMLNRKASGTELSPLQSHILIELSRQPYGCTELATNLCVEKASISRTLRNLIDAGYIHKESDAQDGRASQFKLSHLGKKLLSTLEANADRFTEEALAASSNNEIQFFQEAIGRFVVSLRNARRQRESGLLFRRLEPADNSAIANIIRESFRENKIDHLEGVSLHDPELDCLSEVYKQPDSGYWVAEVNGLIVGGAGLAPLEGEGGICEMQKLFFKKEVQGMGLGRRMIAFILSQAAGMGYQSCYLETLEELRQAVRLYEAFGFEHLPERLGNTGHNSCGIFMLRKL